MYSARINKRNILFLKRYLQQFHPFEGRHHLQRGEGVHHLYQRRGSIDFSWWKILGWIDKDKIDTRIILRIIPFFFNFANKGYYRPLLGLTTLLPLMLAKLILRKSMPRCFSLIKKRADCGKRMAYSTAIVKAHFFNSILVSSYTTVSLLGSLALHYFSSTKASSALAWTIFSCANT